MGTEKAVVSNLNSSVNVGTRVLKSNNSHSAVMRYEVNIVTDCYLVTNRD